VWAESLYTNCGKLDGGGGTFRRSSSTGARSTPMSARTSKDYLRSSELLQVTAADTRQQTVSKGSVVTARTPPVGVDGAVCVHAPSPVWSRALDALSG